MEAPEPIKSAKQEEPVSTLYQYVPTEPVILSPQPTIISPEQEIAELREIVRQLIVRVEKVA